jgi:hypothetical protein
MPKNLCLVAATGGLYATLTSQVVMYAPAERAENFSLSRLSPLPFSVVSPTTQTYPSFQFQLPLADALTSICLYNILSLSLS